MPLLGLLIIGRLPAMQHPFKSSREVQWVSPRSALDRASAFSIVFNCSGSSRWPSASKCSLFG